MYSPITKQEAAEKGLKHYFTGISCNRGHVKLRLVRNGECTGCISDRKNGVKAPPKPKVVAERKESRSERERIARINREIHDDLQMYLKTSFGLTIDLKLEQ